MGEFDVIGIDEGQFFPDIVPFCEDMANGGKVVIVAALDGTFQRKGFGSILELVPLAESVTKLTAVCMMCYADGSFSKRIGSETAVEVIGGADKYVAVCRACFNAEPRSAKAFTPTATAQACAQMVEPPTPAELSSGDEAAAGAVAALESALGAMLPAQAAVSVGMHRGRGL